MTAETHSARALIVLACCCGAVRVQGSNACASLFDETRDALINYVRKLIKLPEKAALDLARSEPYSDTCYRKLEFSVGGQSSTIVLYLSPDQRFLLPDLFDSHVDPIKAEEAETARIDGEISAYLAIHRSPVFGKRDAPVTIAVFSDFQCPFCKKAMQILMREVLPGSGDRVRIAYLHYPIPTHQWARAAAEAAGCLQNSTAFWRMQEFLFDHQADINPRNLMSSITDDLGSSSDYVQQLRSCTGSKEAARRVDDDMALGRSLNVSATPTLFINGQRMVGLKSAAEIEHLISQGAK